MKKWRWIIGAGSFLAIASIFGTGLWMKANLQNIVQHLSGRDIRFADVDVHYAPIPAIVLTDLVLKEGLSSVKVPQLKLYPELKDILKGQISLKKAVLEGPRVQAFDQRNTPGDDRRRSGPPSMSAISDGTVVVNRGEIVFQSANGDALRGTLSGRAQKGAKGLSVNLKNASIQEIGLEFTGQMDITSFKPLKVTLNAQRGTFDPHAVKAFLLKFGYISQIEAHRIPSIKRMDAQGLQVDFNDDTGDLNLKAAVLKLDDVELEDLSVSLTGSAGFSVTCPKGVLDTASIYDWFRQNNHVEAAMKRILEHAKLKAIAPRGSVRISSLKLNGQTPANGPDNVIDTLNGGVDVDGAGLVLHIVAENDQAQSISFTDLSSRIMIQNGGPAITVDRLSFLSSTGGEGNLSGHMPLPIDFKGLNLKSSIHHLNIFNSTLDLQFDKGPNSATTFDMALGGTNFDLSSSGTIHCPGRKASDVELILRKLHINQMKTASKQTPSQGSDLDRTFETGDILSGQHSAQMIVNDFKYEGLPRLKGVTLQFESGNDKATLQGAMEMGGVHLKLGAVGLPPGQVALTLAARGTDVDLTSLIACFSTTLPVYLSGRIFINGDFVVSGKTPRELLDGAQGEMTIVLNQGMVKQLSGLDPRLGFILDILKSAGIRTNSLDTIALTKGIINGQLHKGRLIFHKFSVVGPTVSAWGSGELALEEQHLTLSGGVKTAFGVKKQFDIDRILEKEKS